MLSTMRVHVAHYKLYYSAAPEQQREQQQQCKSGCASAQFKGLRHIYIACGIEAIGKQRTVRYHIIMRPCFVGSNAQHLGKSSKSKSTFRHKGRHE